MGVLPDWMIEDEVVIRPFEPAQSRPNTISYGVTSYGYDIRAGFQWKVFTNVWGSVVDPKAFDPKGFVDVDVSAMREEPNGGWSMVCKECNMRQSAKRIMCCSCNKALLPVSHVLIPPNSFALCESIEYFEIPRNCLALVIGKSTYARCGIVLNCTPLEPEWKGHITLEVSNTTPLPAKMYAGEGIGQVLFLRTDVSVELMSRWLRMTQLTDSKETEERVTSWLRDLGCRKSYADKKGKYQDQKGGPTLPKVD